jgi:septum site-determining protein MinC
MNSDSAFSETSSGDSQYLFPLNRYSQVSLKREGTKLLLVLPKEDYSQLPEKWLQLWQEFKHRLNSSEKFWQPGTEVHLIARDRLLDGRQLQIIAEALREVDLQLKWICTSRRQTAVVAATAGYSVKQESAAQSFTSDSDRALPQLAEPLYLQTTVRSGIEVRHLGTVILLGDLNPGGTLIAAGDILVWGALRGIAHAGALGNKECRIMALKMEPTQLRIADVVARAPESSPTQFDPEVAYIAAEGIRLTKAMNFAKTHSFSTEVGSWKDS